MSSVRIGVVDDHTLFRKGLVRILNQLTDGQEFQLVFDTDSAKTVLMKRDDIDLLLLDLNLQGQDGLDLISTLKELRSDLKILVISMYVDDKIIRDALKRGADGYLTKSTDEEELLLGIREVLEGKVFLGKNVSLSKNIPFKKLPSEAVTRFNVQQKLTRREQEILMLIVQGKSNKDMASELFISKDTVSVHRKNLMRKLGAKSIIGLIKVAHEFNLI
ncbi:MAG: response regulator transcription factor [Bacteroidota bacterium]|nr:response regulator transcription factor [Bacteroidota bacterium]